MKLHKLILPVMFLLIISLACQTITSATQASPSPSSAVQIFPTDTPLPVNTVSSAATPAVKQPTSIPPTTAPGSAALVADMLRNMNYKLPESGKTVPLKDGKYESGQGSDYILAVLSEVIAFGDLNGDGLKDAAVILSENMGGSGSFESLVVVLNEKGQPVQGASASLGDRVQVKTITAEGDRLTLDMLVHGPNDPLCCPSQPHKQTYTLTSKGLLLSHITSTTPDQQERIIQILHPKNRESVSTPLQLSGNETMAPLENTMAYKILDLAGNELASGSFTVNAAAAGSPSTFETSIPLDKLSSGNGFWLQILDLSAADGSILAMDAVELVIK